MAKPGAYDFYCQEALTGKTKIRKVFESDKVLAFHHTKPGYDIHIVIIPKEHIQDLTHLQVVHKEMVWEIMMVTKKIVLELGLDDKGLRLLTNLGNFQDTPHLHWHLVGGKKK